ncbi:MAG: hypothetical protein COX40_00890 [Candidatus Omnitrophica bacterium CG23_combo_of_CG06-09_8_20_14_all_40_11]|nr:MAG: hypothetical protein COX40_00890 [Candidatus Omnitrophica bacterium CG23_combo_of_CG06-09_8_20_14_all_40_11]
MVICDRIKFIPFFAPQNAGWRGPLIMEKNKGRSFVTIMIITVITALFLRVTVNELIKGNIAQNEANALSALKLISAALENYAKDNQGIFPANLSILTQTNPVYLNKDYIEESPIKGYSYSCSRLDSSGYNCSAIPVKCKTTGKIVYNISTGGLFVSENCKEEE